MDAAATRIQRVARKQVKRRIDAAILVQRAFRKWKKRMDRRTKRDVGDRFEAPTYIGDVGFFLPERTRRRFGVVVENAELVKIPIDFVVDSVFIIVPEVMALYKQHQKFLGDALKSKALKCGDTTPYDFWYQETASTEVTDLPESPTSIVPENVSPLSPADSDNMW